MRAAVDVMGGDQAPGSNPQGLLGSRALARSTTISSTSSATKKSSPTAWPSQRPHARAEKALQDRSDDRRSSRWTIRRSRRFATSRTARIAVMCKMAAKGEADVVISAGNTGACVAAAQLRMRTLPGVARPGIAVILPTFHGPVVICDVGANVDAQAEASRAIRDHGRRLFAPRSAASKTRASVCCRIGEEDAKGNRSSKKRASCMRDEPQINFVGNVEGRDLFKGVVDVVVCDGFVGNIILKFTEGIAEGLFQTIIAELQEDRAASARAVQAGDEEDLRQARLAGIRRRAAAGRRRILPDLPRPNRSQGDQERHPRRQAACRTAA